MVFAILACLALEPLAFPTVPIASEVEGGRQSAAKGRPLDAIFQKDRKAIGKWSNGGVATAVEHVILLSPSLVSRWLGYLERKQWWDATEKQVRWNLLKYDLDGRLTFLVRLSAYPKRAVADLSEEISAKVENVSQVSLVVTAGGQKIDRTVARLALWQSRERSDFERYHWWLDAEMLRPLVPDTSGPQSEPPLPLGDFFAAWYLVQAPLLPECHKGFELRVLSDHKERVAAFK